MRFLIYFLPFAFIVSMVLPQPNQFNFDDDCRFSNNVDGETRKFFLIEQVGDGEIIMYTNLEGKEKIKFRENACIEKRDPIYLYMDF